METSLGEKKETESYDNHSENRALNVYDGIKNTTKRNPPHKGIGNSMED